MDNALPSPYEDKRPKCLPSDPLERRNFLKEITASRLEMDKMAEEYYNGWAQPEKRKKINENNDDKKEKVSEENVIGVFEYKHYRECLNVDKMCQQFSEESLQLSNKSLLEDSSLHIIAEMAENEAFAVSESGRKCRLIYSLCSVIQNKEVCMKIFKVIQERTILWYDVEQIIANWGFEENDCFYEPSNLEQSKIAEHNIVCILFLIKNSLTIYSANELTTLTKYLVHLSFDPLCLRLGHIISPILIRTIDVLTADYKMSNINLRKSLNIDNLPLSCVLTFMSNLAVREDLYQLTFCFALEQIFKTFSFQFDIKTEIRVKTLMKIMFLEESSLEGAELSDVSDDIVYSLYIFGFILTKLVVEKDTVAYVKEMVAFVERLISRFKINQHNSPISKSLFLFDALCKSKIKPFITLEERIKLEDNKNEHIFKLFTKC